MGWIGVQLDGCLAETTDGPLRADVIGRPIAEMTLRTRGWLRDRQDVRIVTPRVQLGAAGIFHVQEWTRRHLGRTLRVTCQLDDGMAQLWGVNVVGVIPNTGRPAGPGPCWA